LESLYTIQYGSIVLSRTVTIITQGSALKGLTATCTAVFGIDLTFFTYLRIENGQKKGKIPPTYWFMLSYKNND